VRLDRELLALDVTGQDRPRALVDHVAIRRDREGSLNGRTAEEVSIAVMAAILEAAVRRDMRRTYGA
jgi:hypothetical protein